MMKNDIPLVQASEIELATAVQTNLFALFRAMATTLPGGELVEGGNLSRHHTFPTNPMFKGVWGTNLPSDEVDSAIDEAIDWFGARNAPYFFWWTGPGTSPADLGARLQAHGLLDMAGQQRELASGIRQTEQGAPGMVADLNQVDESLLTKTPPEFVIQEVSRKTGLYDFKKVFVETYEIPEWAGQAWVDATQTIGIGQTPWRMFVGYLGGEPVATNMLFNGAGVASVYAVATLPASQRMGIGAAITLKPLLDVRKMGYRYGVLFSTEMGIRVYQRIGFRLISGRINRYLWRNEGL
jgi:ribosomal protein S18 acetylase RimI-like enzyme